MAAQSARDGRLPFNAAHRPTLAHPIRSQQGLSQKNSFNLGDDSLCQLSEKKDLIIIYSCAKKKYPHFKYSEDNLFYDGAN